MLVISVLGRCVRRVHKSVVSVLGRRNHEGPGWLGLNTELSATEALPRGKEKKKKDPEWSSMVEYLPRVCKVWTQNRSAVLSVWHSLTLVFPNLK